MTRFTQGYNRHAKRDRRSAATTANTQYGTPLQRPSFSFRRATLFVPKTLEKITTMEMSP